MKKLVKLFATVLVSISFLTSCNHEEIQPLTPTATIEEANANIQASSFNNEVMNSVQSSAATITYTTSPTINNYTNCSGNIRAKIINQSGANFTIRIERCTNQQLLGAGNAYVRVLSSTGTQAGKAAITSNYWYIDIPVSATFSTGYVDFYPVVILSNGTTWNGNPIRITAQMQISATFPVTAMKDNSNNPSQTYYARAGNVFTGSLVGQCTWYTYGRVQELSAGGYISNSDANTIYNALRIAWGRNAQDWISKIGGSWINTSSSYTVPMDKRKKGMVIVWTFGATGHVGFLEEVSADKSEYRISEFNITNNKYSEKWHKFNSSRTIDPKYPNIYPSFYELSVLK